MKAYNLLLSDLIYCTLQVKILSINIFFVFRKTATMCKHYLLNAGRSTLISMSDSLFSLYYFASADGTIEASCFFPVPELILFGFSWI